MARVMFVSIGTGRNVDDGISKSIIEANPDELVFVCSDSSRSTVKKVNQKLENIFTGNYTELVLKDPNDIYIMMDQIADEMAKYKEKGYSDIQFTVDYTSGTKAMSVAIALTANTMVPGASFRYVGSLVRDSQYGRVISGEEDIKIRRSASYYLGFDDERLARLLFNKNAFIEASEVCNEVIQRSPPLRVRKRLEDFRQLSSFYADWDGFAYAKALEVHENLNENTLIIERLKYQIDNNCLFLQELVSQTGISENGREFGFPCVEFIVDMIQNARRRIHNFRYNDAIIRILRTILAIVQLERYLSRAQDPLQSLRPPLILTEYLEILNEYAGPDVSRFLTGPDFDKFSLYVKNYSLGYGFGSLPENIQPTLEKIIQNIIVCLETITSGLALKWPVRQMLELSEFITL